MSPDLPYPPTYGGRVDIWGRVKVLRDLGFSVDLICTASGQPSPKDAERMKDVLSSYEVISRRNRFLQVLSRDPLQCESREGLARIDLRQRYDVGILESEYVAPVLHNPTLRANYLVLRVHNNEQKYMEALHRSTSVVWKKAYYWTEARKFRRLTPRILHEVDQAWFISADEYESARRSVDRPERLRYLPPPFEVVGRRRFDIRGEKCAVFIGSLFMVNNVEAIKWYLRYVHPRLLDIDAYKFIVAGSSKGRPIDTVRDIVNRSARTELLCDVDDLSSVYKRGLAMVNPMQRGAGVKVKTINAIAAGLPVVSTDVGNEGTGLESGMDVLVANEPTLFAEHVRSLLTNGNLAESLVTSAQEKLQRTYDHGRILERCFTDLFTSEAPQKLCSSIAHQ